MHTYHRTRLTAGVRHLLFTVLLLASPWRSRPLSASEFHLEIEPVIANGGEGRVEFHPTSTEWVTDSTIARAPDLSCVDAGNVKVCVDQSKTAPNKWRKFDYVFYVRTGGPQALAFKFAADPIGKFYDQMATARIALTRDQTALTCALQFPVYSMVVMDLLSADTGKQTASLQGEQLFQVALRSLVPDLDILLTEPVQVYCDLNLWESCSARFVNLRRMGGDNTLPLSPSAPALEIRAIPRSFKALARSLLPFSGDGASTPAAGDPGAGEGGTVHDHLTVAFSYKTRGGLDRVFTHRFPVRFVPGFWSLLLAVAAGVVVGSMIPLAFGKVRVKEWGKAAAAAILLGILVEAFAMVVVKLDSTVQIFRFKLDPFQILPTALLGALVGIRGRKNADALDKVFRTLAAGGANRSEG